MVPERKEDGNFTSDGGIHGESNGGVLLKYKKDLMFMLGLNETMDQLAVSNSVHW